MAYRGDLIACEVDFENVSKGEIPVLFSLNGKEVARSSMKYTLGQELFPFVSLGYEGITVLTKMCCRDRDRFSGVTNEDIQEKIEVLRGDVQHQLAEQARNVQHQLVEQARNVQHQLAEQARNVQHQFAEQARMLSEMRNLVLRLKEVKDKEEQETG
ncbi:uncharacterized protein LOC111331379 [Stylophora pistillata]|nr:uncharacterized protein LOC111331379 [Stylophora pistillata]